MAARLSAERPSRNALTRSGRGAGFSGSARRAMAGFLCVFGERERALINLAPRQTGRVGHFGHRVFDRNAAERLAQQDFGIGDAQLGCGFWGGEDKKNFRRAVLRWRTSVPASRDRRAGFPRKAW